ncbi:WAT1-related protein At5g47470-like [Asparagus officinalis]|uniref:WAT1-related protein At5g47470-like n=1 Tax=Asparagus officinalis TaxID=4686 RepID=UPI00098E6023|nr:WAT1-related protein At5g47470-like [Asparagus officinalis]
MKTLFSYPSFPASPTAGGAIAITWGLPGSDDETMLRLERGGGCFEESLIIFGLISVQVINAIYMVMLTPILASGVRPLFLIIFACSATSIFALPFAIAFERKKWPSRFAPKLIAQILLISLLGVTTFQTLMMMGIERTTPAIASAMPNIAPGIIFIISACLRFEKTDMKCKYTRAKVLGTVICLSGAMVMSILQTRKHPLKTQYQGPLVSIELLQDKVEKNWIIGCFYLLGAVLVVSCSTVLQAVTMIHFPAPLSLCSITSLLGTIFTVCIQIVTEGKVNSGTTISNLRRIIIFMLLGGMVIAMCVSFQTWAVKKKGPVLVSMFSPIQTVFSAILSAIILDQDIKIIRYYEKQRE